MADYSIHTVTPIDATCSSIRELGDDQLSVSCFLVTGKEKAMLLDSGFGKGNIKEVVDGLTDLPVILVNTHADMDHSHGNRLFGPAHMHPAEFDRYHQDVGGNAPVEALWEGDIIDLGGRRLEVIHVPGHTPGSIVLLDAENRILFGGDSVQDDIIFMGNAGRNIPAYIESMKKLTKFKSRFDKVYGAHGTTVLDNSILDDVLNDAIKLRSGEIKGGPIPPPFNSHMPPEAKLYVFGAAKLIC
ncbi:MAG: MBL fold metallo-hydrolase [Oscillospiraceae bacterium]|nr:MBL fold metallo-hydrolase [Oscillospiraceae bacterium]